MKKTFDELCNDILKEENKVSTVDTVKPELPLNAPVLPKNNQPTTTPAPTPAPNTPAVFDQQHPAAQALISALAKTNDPAAITKILQDNKVTLPPSTNAA